MLNLGTRLLRRQAKKVPLQPCPWQHKAIEDAETCMPLKQKQSLQLLR
jgi:hypothetical protein